MVDSRAVRDTRARNSKIDEGERETFWKVEGVLRSYANDAVCRHYTDFKCVCHCCALGQSDASNDLMNC